VRYSTVFAVTLIGVVLFSTISLAREMPSFQLGRLDGSKYDSETDKGKHIVLLEFWGSCCKARVSELKYLEELQTEFGDNVKIYAINIDDARSASRIKPVVKRYKFTFPVLLDPDQEVLSKFSPKKTKPYTVLIDSSGSIIKEIQGQNPGKGKIIRNLINAMYMPVN